jgi:hypothetical protein
MQPLEQHYQPEKVASFIIRYGKVNGSAWWNPKLKWLNLTDPQFRRLEPELKSNGVKVITVDFTATEPSYEGLIS